MILIAELTVIALFAYIPALAAHWIWDDEHHVTENIELHTWHGLGQLWLRPGAVPQYYPVTHTTFWIEYHLWGLHPFGYHLDNILLQVANAVLIALILRRLAVPGWYLAAALFALHPVHVESVAWVTERKNVLSGFFYLLAMRAALKVWRIAPTDARFSKSKYALCLVLFVLALLSKSVTATWPVVVLLLIAWKRGRPSWRDVGLLIPFFICAAAMGSLTAWMEKHVVGAVGNDWNWTGTQRVLIASRAVWFYLGKLFWPHPLIFIYPKWQIDSARPLLWAFPAALIVLATILVMARRRLGAGPLVALIFFVFTLIPALGFFDVYPMRYSFVADHFQYLASIGPIAVAAALLSRKPVACVPICLVFAVLTWRQAETYADSLTLWRDVVAKDDRSVIGHCNLGTALSAQAQTAAAADQFRRALALDPRFVEAWIGLGLTAQAQDHFDDAADDFARAINAAPQNPLAHWQLGLLRRHEGNLPAARAQFQAARDHLPNPAPAYEQLGEIDLSDGQLAPARQHFLEALAADPDLIDAHNNLAAIAIDEQNLAVARDQCEAALTIDPTNPSARNNMGIVLLAQGDRQQAADFFAAALKSDPDFQIARENLERLKH